jgi:hypothetical protein
MWLAPRRSPTQVDPSPESFVYTLVPAYESAPALRGDGWKTARSIEGCATAIDSRSGTLLSGADVPDSARLALFVAEDQLFIEVHDDKLVTDGKLRDEIEVWHRRDPSGDWAKHCLEDAAPASGTAIRMGDLSTRLVGEKVGKPLIVEQAPTRDGAPLRLRVSLPPKTHAVTVTYRDTDDGKRHSRVFASSALQANDDVTLGVLHPIEPAAATCGLSGDSLALLMTPPTAEGAPVTRL